MPRQGGSAGSAGSSAAGAETGGGPSGTATRTASVSGSKETSAAAGAASASASASGGGRHDLSRANAMEPQVVGPFENHGQCVLTLVNVTATANMKCPIDLKTVVMRARNAEYNPKRFSACVSHVCLLLLLGSLLN